MSVWRFILITIVLMKTKDPRVINAEVSASDDLSPYYNDSAEIEKRLPADVLPRKYVIAISPDLRRDLFHGTVRINLELLKDRSHIQLHSKDLTVSSTKLYREKSQAEVPLQSVFYASKREMLVIKPRRNVSAGDYFLRLQFKGSLKGKMTGFYLSTYVHNKRSTRKLAVTQFEPFYARTAFPCFDEPNLKSIFLVRVVYSTKFRYHARSNMPVAKLEQAKEDSKKTIAYFDPSPPMSTYLVAFLVSDFECLKSNMSLLNGSRIPISVCARPTYKSKAMFALNVTVRAMKYYLETFRVDYPLPKLDLVAIPDFTAGAMENWGLITFRETELLHSENDSSCLNMRSVSLTVAHELAHMWFGNLVTMKWWNDLWLNEGFATYMEHVAVDFLFPRWKLMDSFPLYTKYLSMKHDVKLRARPVVKRTEDPEEIEETFDRMSYQKAAAVIRMLEDAVGRSKFVSAVRNYLQSFQFRNAESREFFESLENITSSAIDVVDFVGRWMRFPGFPVVNVHRDKRGFRLSRRRFTTSKRFQQTVDDGSWTIPIRYITSGQKVGAKLDWFLANFSCVQLSLESTVDWIKLNDNSVGYYIVNYTQDGWTNFNNLLHHNHRALSAMNRADLLHDAFLLARTDLNYFTVMNLTSYLVNEEDYQPWAVAAEWFGFMNRLLGGTATLSRFQSYARSLVDRIYLQVGWRLHAKDTFNDREFRVLILRAACSVGHSHCLQSAGKKLRSFLSEDSSRRAQTLPADIRSIVYSFGLAAVSDNVGSIFESMSRLLAEGDDVQERERMMIGMTGFQDKDTLNRYLERALDESFVRKQDFAELVIKIAANPVGLDVAWNFVRSRWLTLLVKYGRSEHTLGKIVCSIVSLFKDRQKLREARRFFERGSDLKVTLNARRNAMEEAENNINWLDANMRSVEQWLLINGYD